MKAKRGYRKQKTKSPWIGKWLKRYFEKRTSRKQQHFCPNCGYYCTGKSVYCLPPQMEDNDD